MSEERISTMTSRSIPDPDDIIHDRLLQPMIDRTGIDPRIAARALHVGAMAAAIASAVLMVHSVTLLMGSEMKSGDALLLSFLPLAFPALTAPFVWSDRPTRSGSWSGALRLLHLIAAIPSLAVLPLVAMNRGPADLKAAMALLCLSVALPAIAHYVRGCRRMTTR